MRDFLMASLVLLTLSLASCDTPTGARASEDAPVEKAVTSFEDLEVGPAIGESIPMDTVLATTQGADTTLADAMGKKGAVLVFSRSVDWCPFCQAQLKRLNDIAPQIEQSGYLLVGVTYDDPAKLQEFTRNQSISYHLLSDGNSTLIDALGIRDPQYTVGPAVGVPYASMFVVDSEGTVKARAISEDYKVRPSNEEALSLLEKAG